MPLSLVLGVNGQDGSYLAEALLRRGHAVIGVGTLPQSRYVPSSSRFRYVTFDLRETEGFAALLREANPDYAFHFAAVHGSDGFSYEKVWRDMMAVNVSALHVMLEHARTSRPDLRVVYASSRKIFPGPLEGVIDETTPVSATCLYGIGKIAARDLLSYYRAQHSVAGTNLILFNHDSPRRLATYFLPTIARALTEAQRNPLHKTNVRTLDFMIDWSDAAELMDITADIAEKSDAGELLLASSVTLNAREAVAGLFARHGLDVRKHIAESAPRSSPGPRFKVSLARLEREIGRRPVKTLDDIVGAMLADTASESLR